MMNRSDCDKFHVTTRAHAPSTLQRTSTWGVKDLANR